MRKIVHTSYVHESDFGDIELRYEADEDTITVEQLDADHLLVGYLVHDEDGGRENPLEEDEWGGKIVVNSRDYGRSDDIDLVKSALGLDQYGDKDLSAIEEDAVLDAMIEEDLERVCGLERHYSDVYGRDFSDEEIARRVQTHAVSSFVWQSDWFDAVRERLYDAAAKRGEIGDPYVVNLLAYIHGGIHISVAGTRSYPDMQWDCSDGWWLPGDNKSLRKELEGQPDLAAGRKRAVELATQACETYNMWQSNDCWGVIVHEYVAIRDEDGELEEWELTECDEFEVWGYWGHKYAKEELAGEMERMKKVPA